METLVILFILVLSISFLCSVLESVLLSTNIAYISVLEEKNQKAGKALKKLKENIDKSISSILILNTFANTLGATAIGIQAQKVFEGNPDIILAVSIILTFLILFVAEIIPKTIGAVYWKQLAIPATRIINFFIIITYPIIIITLFVTKKINKNDNSSEVTREEILHTALLSEENGVINDLESDIIENTLTLKQMKIKDILDDERTYKFSRVPVYKDSIDNIVGMVLTKKLFKNAIINKEQTMQSIMIKVDSINENIPVSKALHSFTKVKGHLLMVTDSYDQTEGIVTLEDCIETLLGLEIMDESDTTEDMRKLASSNMRANRKIKENQK